MAFQLIYTSAPRLLQAGRTGFGTVAKHPAVRGALQSEIERFSQFSRQEGLKQDRVIFQYRCLSISGTAFHVISRLKDAGSDYTGRTNHIAHHVIFTVAEAQAALAAGITPVDVIFNLNNRSFWRDSWHASPIEFGPEEEIALSSLKPAISLPATYWQGLTGTPASAAILAPGATSDSCWLIYAPGHGEQLLALLGESLLLHQNPWRISFANELQPTDRVEEIVWRGMPEDSPVCIMAAQSVRPILDLTRPESLPHAVSEFTSTAEFGLHQKIATKNESWPLPSPDRLPLPPMEGLPPPTGKRLTSTGLGEKPFGQKLKPSFEDLKGKPRKKAAAPARSPIALNLTITAALVAAALAAGVWFLYAVPKMQREHKAAEGSYENAKETFLRTTGIPESKVQAARSGEQSNLNTAPANHQDADGKDLETAAMLLGNAARNYKNTAEAFEDIKKLKGNQTRNNSLNAELNIFGNKLSARLVDRIEREWIEWLANTSENNFAKLKQGIDGLYQSPENIQQLEETSKEKLMLIKSFLDNLKACNYPALIDFLYEKKYTDCNAAKKVDREYSNLLRSKPPEEQSKELDSITPPEKLAAYHDLAELKNPRKSSPIADASLSTTPPPAQPPKALGETTAVVIAKPAESPACIKWLLLPDKITYAAAIEKESSSNLGLPKQDKTDLADLIKPLNGMEFKKVKLTAATRKDASGSPFIFVLNDKSIPVTVIVNCESYNNQTISRDLIDASTQGIIILKEKTLFDFLSSQTVETSDGKKVLFYFQLFEAGARQVTDARISDTDRLYAEKKHLEDLTKNERELKNKPAPLNTEEQYAIDGWLGVNGKGEKGPACKLFKDQITFKDFLIKKDKSKSSSAPLVELLIGLDVKRLVREYLNQGLSDFKNNKGSTTNKQWSDANKSSITKLQNKINSSSTITEFISKAAEVNDRPVEVLTVFGDAYLPVAKSLDGMAEFYQETKKKLEDLGRDKITTAEQVNKYSEPSKCIKFIAKDQSSNVILELSIEQPK